MDITISGLPLSVSDFPRDMVLTVFWTLGIPELDVRVLTRKRGGAIGDRRRASTARNALPRSLIVDLKSPCVRDYIIFKTRDHGALTVKDVFAMDEPRHVSVKEYLPAPIYNLLCCTEDLASRAGFKYAWTRSGSICVRKSDGSPVISIITDANVSKLE